MKYKPSYGDKQREAQKRKKEEQLRNKETPSTSGDVKTIGTSEERKNRSKQERLKRAS